MTTHMRVLRRPRVATPRAKKVAPSVGKATRKVSVPCEPFSLLVPPVLRPHEGVRRECSWLCH